MYVLVLWVGLIAPVHCSKKEKIVIQVFKANTQWKRGSSDYSQYIQYPEVVAGEPDLEFVECLTKTGAFIRAKRAEIVFEA